MSLSSTQSIYTCPLNHIYFVDVFAWLHELEQRKEHNFGPNMLTLVVTLPSELFEMMNINRLILLYNTLTHHHPMLIVTIQLLVI